MGGPSGYEYKLDDRHRLVVYEAENKYSKFANMIEPLVYDIMALMNLENLFTLDVDKNRKY